MATSKQLEDKIASYKDELARFESERKALLDCVAGDAGEKYDIKKLQPLAVKISDYGVIIEKLQARLQNQLVEEEKQNRRQTASEIATVSKEAVLSLRSSAQAAGNALNAFLNFQEKFDTDEALLKYREIVRRLPVDEYSDIPTRELLNSRYCHKFQSFKPVIKGLLELLEKFLDDCDKIDWSKEAKLLELANIEFCERPAREAAEEEARQRARAEDDAAWEREEKQRIIICTPCDLGAE